MQNADGGTLANDGFSARQRKRFSRINGLAALSFLVFGGAELVLVAAGHFHSSADQMQAIVIAGLSLGLCALAAKLPPEL